MSLLDRRFLLILPLLLAACGFEPAYGPGGSGTALQNRVQIEAPEDRNAYLVVREIESRLGRAGAPAFALDLDIATNEEGLAIDSADNTTRFNIVGTADFVLRDLGTGQTITAGRAKSFTGYSATGTTVATLAAERDAQQRLMTILADQIMTRLLAANVPG
jgi:LPS-assembly lipoprotein